MNLAILGYEDEPGVIVIERNRADGTWRNLKRFDLLQGVSAEYAHAFSIYGDVVLATLRESDALGVLVLMRVELLQVWMQDVVQADLVL